MSAPRAPLVIAHRGASGHEPENTPSAFELAVRQRADMIETDLHRTADGAIVLSHDPTLDHLGDHSAIAQRKLEEIRGLDAGGGQRVPTLEETLDAFGKQVEFNLEIKKGKSQYYEGIEAQALAEVESRGLLPRMLFSSFWDPILERVRAGNPQARIGLLLSIAHPYDAVARAKQLGAEALHPEAPLATPELVNEAHDAGLAVYVFTVDDPDEMRRYLGMGVDGLFTNYPQRMREILATH